MALRPLVAVLTLLPLSCAGPTEQSGSTTVEGDGGARATPDPQPVRLDPRALVSIATFGALVDVARALDEEDQGDSDAGCVLSSPRRGAGFRFTGDVALSLRPMPAAVEDLDEQLTSAAGPARVLTQWAPFGEGGELFLSGFTASAAPAGTRMAVLVVTDQGVYVRYGHRSVAEDALGSVTAAEAIQAVATSSLVFVSAEAATPLAALREVLVGLQSAVALALVLPAGTALPEETLAAARRSDDGTEGLCPDGLPQLPSGSARGTLQPAALRATLQTALGTSVRACLEGAASFGALDVAMRIGPTGAVTHACAVHDQVRSSPLRACVLEAAAAVTFPAPEPAGVVELVFPLNLAPSPERGLCTE